ncbi:MAG: hypothetical protein H7Z43_14705, partial [Clostridia bacterium]|nr:hypothetical protein [Deltaproteobacteria bacterium]
AEARTREAEERRRNEEAEARRLAAEADRRRAEETEARAREAEERRRVEEADARRRVEETEARRLEDVRRSAEHAEAQRRVEAERVAAENARVEAQEARRAAEEARREAAEERRIFEESRRKYELERKAAEAADAQRRADDETRLAQAAAATAREAEAKRHADRLTAEAQRQLEEERRTSEEAHRLVDEERRVAEDARRLVEEERRLAEDARKRADETQRAAEEARRVIELEAQRRIDDERRVADEARKRADEMERLAEQARQHLHDELARFERDRLTAIEAKAREAADAERQRVEEAARRKFGYSLDVPTARADTEPTSGPARMAPLGSLLGSFDSAPRETPAVGDAPGAWQSDALADTESSAIADVDRTNISLPAASQIVGAPGAASPFHGDTSALDATRGNDTSAVHELRRLDNVSSSVARLRPSIADLRRADARAPFEPAAPVVPSFAGNRPHARALVPSEGIFGMRTDFADLLAEVAIQGVTGRVDFTSGSSDKVARPEGSAFHRYGDASRIERGIVQKSVVFENGRPVDAYSSQVFDRMEEYLLREGRITRAQYQEVRVKRLRSPRIIGSYLTAEGHLKPEELFGAVRGHLEDLIYSLFEWEQGTYVYVAEHALDDDRVMLDKDPRALVVEGIRRKYLLPRLIEKVGSPSTLLTRTDPEGRIDAELLGLTLEEKQIARLVDGARNVDDIVFSSGFGALRVYQVLAALLSTGAIEVNVRGIEGVNAAGATDLDDIDRRRIEERVELARHADYFQVLGVARSATAYEVDLAFDRIARELAPGRLSPSLRNGMQPELSEIERVLEDARDVLRDSRTRDAYARHLPSS